MSRVAPPRGGRAPPEGATSLPSRLQAAGGPLLFGERSVSLPAPDPSALLYVESCFLFSVREIFDIFKNNLTQREQQKFCTKI